MSDLRMVNVTKEDIERTARRLDECAEGGDPYTRLGVLGMFTFHRDQLIANLTYNVNVYYSETMFDEDEVIDMAYEDYVSDLESANVNPLGETVAKQYINDAFRAVLEWTGYYERD